MEGYSVAMNIRTKSNNAKKHSGGIAVIIKSLIRNGVKFQPVTNSEYMWFKLDKTFFNMARDIYVAVVYICPQYSSYASKTQDIMELLENDLSNFTSNGCQAIICGDFNAVCLCNDIEQLSI